MQDLMQHDVQQDVPFYVEGDPLATFTTLSEARVEAGRRQHLGERRSLQIMQEGKVVDLKRF
jgi:hypothetical protein